MRTKNKKYIFMGLLITILITLYYIFIFIQNYVFLSSIARYHLVQAKKNVTNDKEKIILFRTTFFTNENWLMPNLTNGYEYLKRINCPVSNCIFTHDKNYLSEPYLYDAIVFHAAQPWIAMDLPKTRSPHQSYVAVMLEAPPNIKHNLILDHNFYNLTMTYRFDSDILWHYGKIVDAETGNVLAPSLDVVWREPDEFDDKAVHSLLENKSKSVAWFVSNCNAFSKREEIAKKLQETIEVDIYGKCGPLKCVDNEPSQKCEKMLNSTYKFYLAFENALCTDYVTEKLYRAMENYIIPIVFNGASLKYFVPPQSVIDANDFETVQDLANYLKFLSNNSSEYKKYFWWKKYYKVNQSSHLNAFCDLCRKINDMEHKKQVYEDINKWWNEDVCITPKIMF